MTAPGGWRRSSHCAAGDCVEFFQFGDGVVGIRNPRNSHGFAMLTDAEGWMAFVAGVKAGEFDVAVGERHD